MIRSHPLSLLISGVEKVWEEWIWKIKNGCSESVEYYHEIRMYGNEKVYAYFRKVSNRVTKESLRI